MHASLIRWKSIKTFLGASEPLFPLKICEGFLTFKTEPEMKPHGMGVGD